MDLFEMSDDVAAELANKPAQKEAKGGEPQEMTDLAAAPSALEPKREGADGAQRLEAQEEKPERARFKFVNFEGLRPHNQRWAPRKGKFVLPSESPLWELHWGINQGCYRGGLPVVSIEVQATGTSSCRVVFRNVDDPAAFFSFEIPNNAASDVEAALNEREGMTAAAREQLTARAAEKAAQGPAPQASQKPIAPVSFNPAHYLGGHPNLGRKRSGTLWFSPLEVGIGITRPKVAVLQLAEVASVEVTSTQVAKNKVKAEIMFGVFGGLGAKGSETDTAIAVYTKDDQIAYYQVDKKTEAQVRARITPVLRAAGVPFRDEAVVQTQQEALREAVAQAVQSAQSGGAPSVADELAKLAQLRDQGILTDEEFAAQKAKLLG